MGDGIGKTNKERTGNRMMNRKKTVFFALAGMLLLSTGACGSESPR